MRTHGLITTYNLGCRCPDCRAASAEKSRRRRARYAATREPRPFRNGRPTTEDPMRWADSAPCRAMALDVFFPPHGGKDSYTLAKSICASCDVRDDCLAYALRTQQPAGCWGGLNPDERWRLMDRTA